MCDKHLSFIHLQTTPTAFSGNLSLDVTKSSKWNISLSGLCGMRPKKMNTE